MKVASIAMLFFSAFTSLAYADCVIRGPSFFPAQNDTVSYSAAVTGNGSCQRNLTTRGLTFTSIQIVGRPAHGSLSSSGVSGFNYQAKSGFKGADAFTVKACATGPQGAGCSTLIYNLSIE